MIDSLLKVLGFVWLLWIVKVALFGARSDG